LDSWLPLLLPLLFLADDDEAARFRMPMASSTEDTVELVASSLLELLEAFFWWLPSEEEDPFLWDVLPSTTVVVFFDVT
jgi:hypothetical protein